MKRCKVKINNFEYSINIVGPGNNNLLMPDGRYHFGVTEFREKAIYIANNLPDKTMTNTLIHELVHAYIDSYGMLQIEWNDEIVADFVATYFENILMTLGEIRREMEKEGGKNHARRKLGKDRSGSKEDKVQHRQQ